ncbi:MAG: Flp pilus assembly complex ATPase component TadA [Phycisphaerae bacterium]|nr:Flp pilus assembly complex ATPase component TadA [Phycisphaerae bacterium]
MPTLAEVQIATLADGLILVSPWKPLVMVVTLCGWAWVIANVYDKHAARFFLPRTKWNLAHLTLGTLSIAAFVLMPVPGLAGFFAGWGAMIVLLGGSLLSYMVSVKNDERVPEDYKIKIGGKKVDPAVLEARKKAKGAGAVKLAIKGPDKAEVPAPPANTPEYELRSAAEAVYISALSKRASQVDIAPVPGAKDGAYAPSFIVDSVRQPGEQMPGPAAFKLIDFWKTAAKLDVNDRRRKLVADIAVSQGADSHKVRVTSIGVQGGMRLTLLFDPAEAVKRKPEDLGLLPDQMAELKVLTGITLKTPDGDPYPEETRKGVVLLAGVPDGGRTTTMLTILQMHDAYTSGVVTVELEQQANLEGIRHVIFDPTAEGADFATAVRSQLRRDPDVLGVAEVPDANTMKEAARSDLERTRIYLSMRAESALAAVDAYLKGLGDNELAAKSLRGAVANRLIRRLCTNCRVAYPPTPDMLKKLGIADPKQAPQLFKKGGQVLIKNKPEVCPVCAGIGYFGCEGVFEVFRFGPEEREFIAQGDLAGLRAQLRKRNLLSLQQAALRKAITGVTSVEEVTRVTSTGT